MMSAKYFYDIEEGLCIKKYIQNYKNLCIYPIVEFAVVEM